MSVFLLLATNFFTLLFKALVTEIQVAVSLLIICCSKLPFK